MTDDIVQRLRVEHCDTGQCPVCPLLRAAAAEIERLRAEIGRLRAENGRLRAENAAWRTGVADAVEPLGFDREAASGPADLLPGLVTLVERLERLRAAGDVLASYVEDAGPGLHDDLAALAAWREVNP